LDALLEAAGLEADRQLPGDALEALRYLVGRPDAERYMDGLTAALEAAYRAGAITGGMP